MNAVENESRLVADACQGSQAAFEVLVIMYEPRVRRMIYGMTQNVQATQDLCQETFLAAYKALPRMKSEELRFAPWLYRIALNLVRTEWRKQKHITIVPFSMKQGDDDANNGESLADNLPASEQFEERVVKQDLVRRVLAQLPPVSAACLLLDAEGFTYNEIAEIQNDTLSAVRSRLSRARQAFLRMYQNLDG